MQHELKTWPEYFQAIVERRKLFEVRVNDRGFSVKDKLILREFDPVENIYSGRKIETTITYILGYGMFGIENGWIVIGFNEVNLIK